MKIQPGDKQIDPYDFYKSPDSEDCLEKTFYYTKYSTVAGAIFSALEMMLISQPTTARASIARFGRFTLPMAGMGLALGSSICIVAKLRGGANDWVNHLIGGAFAGGTVWGAKFGNFYAGHYGAIFVGFFAAYVKYFRQHNIEMFAMRTPEMRENNHNLDFTIKIYDDPGRSDRA